MKETQRQIMFRARQSAFNMAYQTKKEWIFSEQGETKDIEKLAKSLAGKKKR